MAEFVKDEGTSTSSPPSPSSSSSQRRLSLRAVPDEVLKLIFQYCDEDTLLEIEETSMAWKKLCVAWDRDLWEPLTRAVWEPITVNRPSDICLKVRIGHLPTGRLLKSLRQIDLSRCVEKQDFQRMLLAKLLFEGRMQSELKGSDARFAGRYMSMNYPEWSLHIGAYKASYFFALREIHRQEITSKELTQIQWRFRFKQDGEGLSFVSVFGDDGSMSSEMNDHVYQWRVSNST